ncbi:MAG: MSCRAMM family protein, partial [Thermoanaerobaculia bacterium]
MGSPLSIRSKLAVALLASLALAGWVLYAFRNRVSEVGGRPGEVPARPEPVIQALPGPGAATSAEARGRPAIEPPEDHHPAAPHELAAAVKVIDAESRQPIAGARVRLELAPDPSSPPDEGGDRLPRSGSTDARGLFEARGLAPGSYRLSASAGGYLVSGGRKVSLPGQDEEELTVALAPGSAVSGRVLDASGRPVPGAAVRPNVSADTVDESDRSLEGALSLRARTDAEGRYRLDGLPPRKDYVIEATHPDHAPASVKEVALGARESLEGVDLVLLRGGAIAGRVVDEEGNGIAGASLWASPANAGEAADAVRPPFAPPEPSGAPDASTGADGSHRLARLPAGAYTLRARDPARERLPGRREQVEVAEGKTAESVDIVLGPGESLSGRVVDTDGEPVESAEVIASGEASSRARSDAAGEFRITGLRAGKVHINVVKKGYDTVIDEAAVPAGDAVFTLVPRGVIRGIIRAQGQDAFPEFSIQVLCRLAKGEQVTFVESRDPGGRFEVEGRAGVYVLRALVPGFAPSASAKIRLAARERKEGVVIDLQK